LGRSTATQARRNTCTRPDRGVSMFHDEGKGLLNPKSGTPGVLHGLGRSTATQARRNTCTRPARGVSMFHNGGKGFFPT